MRAGSVSDRSELTPVAYAPGSPGTLTWPYLPLLILLVIPAFAAEPNPAPRTVKVAAVQCSSDLGDVVGNTRKLTALVKEAARAGAKIVVLPETSITGYLSQDLKTNWHVKGMPIEKRFEGQDPKDFAEVVPGPVDQAILRAGQGTRHLPDHSAARGRFQQRARTSRATSTRSAWRIRRANWSRTTAS